MRLCSWSRSFLLPVPLGRGPRPSARRVVRAFLAARRRWPAGRLALRNGGVHWDVAGAAGLSLFW